MPKIILKKKSKFTLSECKNDYKATIIKTVWYFQKYKHIDQLNTQKNAEIDSCRYGHLILDKVKEIILRI